MTQELPEEDIVTAIREGNAVAFQYVFDGCYASLCGYAYTMLRDADEAEDVVQSMFVKLWEKREVLEIKQSVRAYLFRAVHHQCLNQLEHRAVKLRHSASSRSESKATADKDIFPAELEARVRVAIDALPPQCRKIFVMSRYEGLRYTEIASQLNISVNTIQNQVCKALKLLRTELKDIALK
jgi:RNA polymerase sigma-70 factor (ECF subfamily)